MMPFKPYNTPKEVLLTNVLQGLFIVQLTTRILLRVEVLPDIFAYLCGVLACIVYMLCKLFVCNADDGELYINDNRIAGIVMGCIAGLCLMII